MRQTSLYNAMRWALWGRRCYHARALMGSAVRDFDSIVGEFGEDVLLNADALEDDNYVEMSVVLLAVNEKGEQINHANSTFYNHRPRKDSEMSISLVVHDGEKVAAMPKRKWLWNVSSLENLNDSSSTGRLPYTECLNKIPSRAEVGCRSCSSPTSALSWKR